MNLRRKKKTTEPGEPGPVVVQILKESVGTRLGGVNAGEFVEVPPGLAGELINDGHAVRASIDDAADTKQAVEGAEAAHQEIKALAKAIADDAEVVRLAKLETIKRSARSALQIDRERVEADIESLTNGTRREKLLAEIDGDAPAVPAKSKVQLGHRLAEIDQQLADLNVQIEAIATRDQLARRDAFREGSAKLFASLGVIRNAYTQGKLAMQGAIDAAKELQRELLIYDIASVDVVSIVKTPIPTAFTIRKLTEPEAAEPRQPRVRIKA